VVLMIAAPFLQMMRWRKSGGTGEGKRTAHGLTTGQPFDAALALRFPTQAVARESQET
jgi:hypothetical protein